MFRIPHIPPKPFDPARAARVKEALAERGFSSDEPLLDSVFGNSPYLGRLAQREPGAGETESPSPEASGSDEDASPSPEPSPTETESDSDGES